MDKYIMDERIGRKYGPARDHFFIDGDGEQ